MTLTIAAIASTRGLVPPPVTLIRTRDVSHAEREVARGLLIPVRRGVVADAAAWRDLVPSRRYLARVHAAILLQPDLILCGESAVALRGGPIFGEPDDVHVLDDPRRTARPVGGIRTHTTRADREVVEIDGYRLVGPVDSVVDVARSRHHAVGLAVADWALRDDRSLTAEMLVAANESRLTSRGRRHARWVVHRASASPESVLESISLAAIEWLGFDAPELQHTFATDGRRDRADMWWGARRVIGEADGDIKYDGSLQPGAVAIRDEKARDRRLLRHADHVVHWGWRDVSTVDPLRSALRRAGLTQRGAEDSRELAGLRLLHRSAR